MQSNVIQKDINGNQVTLLSVRANEADQYPVEIGAKKAQLFVDNLPQIDSWLTGVKRNKGSFKETIEIENGKYPWTLAAWKADKLFQAFDAVSQFAQSGGTDNVEFGPSGNF